MVSYEHIFFDLDGTLTDPIRGLIGGVRAALRRFGIAETDEASLRRFVGPPLVDSFQRFYGLSPSQSAEAVEIYKDYYGPVGLLESTVYPGAEDMLRRLKAAGYALSVATCKPEPFALRQLEHFGLAAYFACISGGAMDESSTKQDVVSAVLSRCGITAPDRVLMVGDRKFDMLGARQCGITRCMGVLYGYGSREELLEAGAYIFADSPKEVADLILSSETE